MSKYNKVNKYNNKKTFVDGIKFDSKAEANRYCELKLMERAGIIKDLELQKRFELIPEYKDEDETIEESCVYKADFVYYDNERQKYVVEDVKGCKTGAAYQLFVIKRKLMLQRYGIRVVEIG